MIIRILPFLLLLFAFACNSEPLADAATEQEEMETPTDPAANLPADFRSVLEAHGGLAAWQKQNTLSFSFPKGEGKEKHTVDLRTRRELIEQPTATIGYDGEKSWVVSEGEYEGDPLFYRNLMFYFYAMPFVLADPGVNYTATEPLEFDGKSYPGIKISYDSGVGLSPNDNYYLHYDADTKQMRWLGYTVTYRSGEVSDNVSWIHYPEWGEHAGIALPNMLVWHKVEAGQPTTPRDPLLISEVMVSEEVKADAFFAVREGAQLFE